MKKLTDSDKWRDPWFRQLPPKLKCFWQYITDSCDHAGIWEEDYDLCSFEIGEKITKEEVSQYFSDRVEFLSTQRLYIKKYIAFQKMRHPNVIKQILKSLEANGLSWPSDGPALVQPWPSSGPKVEVEVEEEVNINKGSKESIKKPESTVVYAKEFKKMKELYRRMVKHSLGKEPTKVDYEKQSGHISSLIKERWTARKLNLMYLCAKKFNEEQPKNSSYQWKPLNLDWYLYSDRVEQIAKYLPSIEAQLKEKNVRHTST